MHESQLHNGEIQSHWEQLFQVFHSAISIKSIQDTWKSHLISILPPISSSSPAQIAIWATVSNSLIDCLQKPSDSKKKGKLMESIDEFVPVLNNVLKYSHQFIQNKISPKKNKKEKQFQPSGLFLLNQAIHIIDSIIKLFSYLCKLKQQQFLLRILELMEESLLTWINEPKPRSQDLTAGECDKLRSAIEKLWKAFGNSIQSCKNPCEEKELLFGVEYLLSAAFQSKFRWLKSAAVKLWNNNFAEYSSTYPPGFKKTLKSLKKNCDIQIPSNIDDDTSEIGEDKSCTEEEMILDSLPIPEIDTVSAFPKKSNTAITKDTKEEEEFPEPAKPSKVPKESNSSKPKKEIEKSDDEFLVPNEKTKSECGKKRPRVQPLTESQKEKRREQQTGPVFMSGARSTTTLTTQEISDELWGYQEEAPNKKRKLENSSLSIYTAQSVDCK